MKFGLMSYDYTINLGNEIQTIAARRFLPKIDYRIDHEKLNDFGDDSNVKMIMNGYYLDCLDAWPPSENIDPLLISMHFSQRKDVQEIILKDNSREFLSNHGPVGCRDAYTQEFLAQNGIDAYFSGCLTLTLDSAKKHNCKDEDNDYIILSLENPSETLSLLKDKTDKKIYVINQDFPPAFENAFLGSIPKSLYNFSTYYSFDEKMFIAENFLRLYENASCIITDRLHCALPSLALETPVLLYNTRQKQERFNGLNELLNVTNIDEYKANYSMFDVENPPENSREYLKIRKNLIRKCKAFTGHINDSCFSDISYNEMLDRNTLFLSNHAYDTRKYIVDVWEMSRKNKNTIQKQQRLIEKQKKEISEYEKKLQAKDKLIEEYENSTSWKITSPLRKIKNR